MTCVAFDGRFIAADTMGDQAWLRMPTSKISRTDRFVLAGSGNLHLIRSYFRKVKDMDLAQILELGYPDFETDKNDPNMIVIGRHQPTLAYYLCGNVWERIERKFHAIGSGRDYAIAAMALGKTAHQAVELAIAFDVHSGGDVECIEV